MIVKSLELEGILLVTPKIFPDDRGFFFEGYHEERYREAGIDVSFVQDNFSCSKRGTIRGMHFQSSPGQAKLVSVAHGEIYDVVVDMRENSPTLGNWLGVHLNGKERQQLFVPVGFAHGFCVLSDEAHVQYKVSSHYNPQTEKGFHYADKSIGIEWPIDDPVLSQRDLQAPQFSEVV